jgi:hypothetical protein
MKVSGNLHAQASLCLGKTPLLYNVKMFQQDDTFCTVLYSLQTALHVSGETFVPCLASNLGPPSFGYEILYLRSAYLFTPSLSLS